MKSQFLLQGIAKWSFDHEIADVSFQQKLLTGITSFAGPLHHHKGNIALTNTELIIEGINEDLDLTILLNTITEIYLGFDDVFPALATKNLGVFWQPLRIKYDLGSCIYLIIDFNGLFTHDKEWFTTLKELLS